MSSEIIKGIHSTNVFLYPGTIQYSLRAFDEENDVIEYYIEPSFNVSDINGTVFLTKTGM